MKHNLLGEYIKTALDNYMLRSSRELKQLRRHREFTGNSS